MINELVFCVKAIETTQMVLTDPVFRQLSSNAFKVPASDTYFVVLGDTVKCNSQNNITIMWFLMDLHIIFTRAVLTQWLFGRRKENKRDCVPWVEIIRKRGYSTYPYCMGWPFKMPSSVVKDWPSCHRTTYVRELSLCWGKCTWRFAKYYYSRSVLTRRQKGQAYCS